MNAQLRTTPRRRIRAKRAVRHLYAGMPVTQWLGFSQGRVYVTVLRCYDAGQANGVLGNRWDRWAANCRGDA